MRMSGDLAYTVGIERGEMRVAGRDELSPMAERVTMISRRENGAWKLIPRHADPISSVQAPESVIQQEISHQPSRTQRLDDRLSARPFGGSKQAGDWVRFSQANPLPVLLPDTPEDRREEKYEATSFGRTLLTVWVIQPLSRRTPAVASGGACDRPSLVGLLVSSLLLALGERKSQAEKPRPAVQVFEM